MTIHELHSASPSIPSARPSTRLDLSTAHPWPEDPENRIARSALFERNGTNGKQFSSAARPPHGITAP
jgi:hypothetical protein